MTKINSNLDITIGVPSDPLPESVSEEIASIIRMFPEIHFAFLPELFIPGKMEEPESVLILVTSLRGAELEMIMIKLNEEIGKLLPDGVSIGLTTLEPDHELIGPVIETGCLIEINDHKIFERCNNL